MNPHLPVGYVSRAHGTGGEVVVRTFDPASEVLLEVERVWVKRRDGAELEMTIESCGQQNKDLRVAFTGVRGRAAAEALVGSTVMVFRDDLDSPDDGEYFQGDLIGLTAQTPEGQKLGVIEEIWNSGPVPNLVIRDGDREWMVPFAEEFVPNVNLEARVVTVKPLEFSE